MYFPSHLLFDCIVVCVYYVKIIINILINKILNTLILIININKKIPKALSRHS